MSLIPRNARRGVTLLGLAVAGAGGLAACGIGARSSIGRGPSAAPAGTNQPTSTIPVPATAAVPTASAGPAVATDVVSIQGFKFGPPTIAVKAGTTVTWTNKDDEAHTVLFAFDGSRSPILVNSSNVYSKTFSTPGTYSYHCTIHPFMTGAVEVTA